MLKTALLLCLLFSGHALANETPIKKVVTLMMENRSFDHLLGFLHQQRQDIHGLTGQESNPVSTTDKTSKIYSVNPHAEDECVDDPGHHFEDTTEQIYGYQKPNDKIDEPKMNGFVQNAVGLGHDPSNPLSMANASVESAPIINSLALEFAVFDEWFSSIPGPTDPNREFYMSGTSQGVLTNFNGTLYPQQSYFDWLRVRNITNRAYYQDDPWMVMAFEDMHRPENSVNVFEFDQFFEDVKKGDLPQFTFLQPRMTSHRGPPTWQHPDASIREGDRLIKHVYEALRASSAWEEVAFVITYDEHGGFADFFPPPQVDIPAPDDFVATNGFKFDRLGIRVPTLVISPWIPKGTIVHRPPGPHSSSQYDHTSVMATTNKLLGIDGNMGRRAAWAGTFDHIFTLAEPRHCPETLVDLPEFEHAGLLRQRARKLNEHLLGQILFYCIYNPEINPDLSTCGKDLRNQGDASFWLEKQIDFFMAKIRSRQ